MVCAFTGHRPHKLPWGREENDPRCQSLKIILTRRLQEAFNLGCRSFLCGMAQGCDFYFAEAVLELRSREPDVQLIAMIPCPNQPDGWPEEDRLRYEVICQACDRREILSQCYTADCMQNRNKAMVERADVLISVYDGSPSGTGSTVRYAKQLGLTILPVWV